MKQLLFSVVLAIFFSHSVVAGTPIDFTPHGTQPGLSHGLQEPSNCHSCHAGFYGDPNYDNDKHFMPYTTWAGSMKAQATRDPLFWAALDVANNDIPGVGDFCLKCHTPAGWFKGHVVKPTNENLPLVDGANGCELTGDYVARNSGNNDFAGVTCHFCHRVDEVGPDLEAQRIGNAEVWVDDEVCNGGSGQGPCRKGPYNYTDTNLPPHDWEYSAFIQSSAFCGSCHDVSSPEIEQNGVLSIAKKLIDEQGVETPHAMPIERTYSEWQHSFFSDLIFRDKFDFDGYGQLPVLTQGETCQGCHMPETDSMVARACIQTPPAHRENNLRTHQFAGGNSWIPQVIKAIYGDGLEPVDNGIKELLDLSTTYAENMLQLNSALVDVELVSNDGTNMVVDVKVTNLTGHKLPTGYPEGRRMWLNLLAVDDGGNQLFESGAYDENTGVLTEDPQVKIYEALQGIWNDKLPEPACEVEDGNNQKMFHFVLNNCIYKDNRIPPLGFKGGNDVTLQPVGLDYPEDPQNPGQLVNYDVTRYTIPVTGAQLPVTVSATLKYQTASKEYIDFLDAEATANNIPSENLMCDRSWTVGPQNQTRGAYMKQLWQDHGKSAPTDMVMNVEQFGAN